MTLCYAKQTKPTALKIAAASNGAITAVRWSQGGVYDINWGVRQANTPINPYTARASNKREMRELFKAHNVPMPHLYGRYPTFYSTDGTTIDPWIVGRPDHHTRGKGFWLCKTIDDVSRAMKGTRTKAAATHFMDYIESNHELRVHVMFGKSIRISEKHFEGRSGCHKLYTTIKPTVDKQTLRKARSAAKQALAAVSLDFGAVDVLVGVDGEVYVLEVNSSPGLGGTLPGVYARAFLGEEE
jgi:glutathione synthase/RimK-type ligase-like ATP-grasp enzyme